MSTGLHVNGGRGSDRGEGGGGRGGVGGEGGGQGVNEVNIRCHGLLVNINNQLTA